MKEKVRADQLLFNNGLCESREKAKALIMSGSVYLDGRRLDKPGIQVEGDGKIEIRGGAPKYVSRGGLKLEKALSEFGLDLNGVKAADIGASTGGFTDCMLMNGAEKVYAIDVGYGQLAWKLRNDSRVVVLERTNIRDVTAGAVPEKLDFASVDVSFISLRLVLPCINRLLKEGGEVVALIKPQFEAGREKVGKKGVVRDPTVHEEVLNAFLNHSAASGFQLLGMSFSPIKGPEGNIEYLAHLKKAADGAVSAQEDRAQGIGALVAQSHEVLK
ncbi:MAG: TlyA family RNA methyltransferase [Oscillospiraceae bacterium]|jgi:23S rRNA (cytidine1920-2'-O)/16S rRNA (cytidine1409-2'-O)-methyltransferase|nr:TlyA family RNA methyltransferase [Oscillospiraceae bacterium]